MIVATTIEEVRAAVVRARGGLRAEGRATIGFVPTMGFLHDGHLSLVDTARNAGATFVAVSIFVNPLQFGPSEDLARYPRNEARDRELLESREVDLLFLPPVEVMYPNGSTTTVDAGAVSLPLEGARRPSHFTGVATVVLKLFHIVQPDVAAFGLKDAQQCAVIERMVRDLDLPLNLVFGETVREPDGLAMSSRNAYLSPAERRVAPALYRALRAGENAVPGSAHAGEIDALMRTTAAETPELEIDYLAVVDPLTFERPVDFDRELLLVGAVRVGRTRLIDNIRVPTPGQP